MVLEQHTLLLVELDHWPLSGVVLFQAKSCHGWVVVLAAPQQPSTSATQWLDTSGVGFDLRLRGTLRQNWWHHDSVFVDADRVEAIAALFAHAPSPQLGQDVLVSQMYPDSQRNRLEGFIQQLCLRLGSWKTIQEQGCRHGTLPSSSTGYSTELDQALLEQINDERIRQQLAGIHDAPELLVGRVLRRLPRKIAGGEVHEMEALLQPVGVGALARAWRAENHPNGGKMICVCLHCHSATDGGGGRGAATITGSAAAIAALQGAHSLLSRDKSNNKIVKGFVSCLCAHT
mmetsp:Transcript_72891/g.152185  ORF Transcript_72891/g.152185 Transcript_72891/m.152185 type:complete len:288 (+) Transcript_72891:379-1242(+)